MSQASWVGSWFWKSYSSKKTLMKVKMHQILHIQLNFHLTFKTLQKYLWILQSRWKSTEMLLSRKTQKNPFLQQREKQNLQISEMSCTSWREPHWETDWIFFPNVKMGEHGKMKVFLYELAISQSSLDSTFFSFSPFSRYFLISHSHCIGGKQDLFSQVFLSL